MDFLFIAAVIKIIAIDALLSGDNAVVIALACRGLPEEKRNVGMAYGALAAVALRIIFTGVIFYITNLPGLKLVGGLALLWIAAKMLLDEGEAEEGKLPATTLFGAVTTIVIADATMSIDNVIAVAGAAQGNWLLIIFGLLVSIPFVVFGAKLISLVIDKFPILVWAGAALLGWIGAETVVDDPFFRQFAVDANHAQTLLAAFLGACFVLCVGATDRMLNGHGERQDV